MKRALALPALLLASCVSQKTFDTLQSQKDAMELTLAEKNKALDEQSQRAQRLEGKAESLLAEVAQAKERQQDLEARLSRLTQDMAAASRDKSRLQASVEELGKALAELEKRRAEAEARVAEFRNLLARFKSLIDAGKLKVRIRDGRMVVVLATDVLFGSGSASLSAGGRGAVSEVAGVLAAIPRRSFQVEGHTDNVPIATAQYPSNWELASARAITVVKTMVEAGLPGERVSAASFGDTRPLSPNDSAENKALNRRIDIVIIPDLSTLPGFEELKAIDPGPGK